MGTMWTNSGGRRLNIGKIKSFILNFLIDKNANVLSDNNIWIGKRSHSDLNGIEGRKWENSVTKFVTTV